MYGKLLYKYVYRFRSTKPQKMYIRNLNLSYKIVIIIVLYEFLVRGVVQDKAALFTLRARV